MVTGGVVVTGDQLGTILEALDAAAADMPSDYIDCTRCATGPGSCADHAAARAEAGKYGRAADELRVEAGLLNVEAAR